SSLGQPYADLMRPGGVGAALLVAASGALVLAVVWMAGITVTRHLVASSYRKITYSIAAVGVVLAAIPAMDSFAPSAHGNSGEKPHVVLIGLDSVRRDYVGDPERILAPNIEAFISKAAFFSDTVTPL